MRPGEEDFLVQEHGGDSRIININFNIYAIV